MLSFIWKTVSTDLLCARYWELRIKDLRFWTSSIPLAQRVSLEYLLHSKHYSQSWLWVLIQTTTGKDGKKKKGVAEDRMIRWHHRLRGHEFEQLWDRVKDRGAWCATVRGGSQRIGHNLATEQYTLEIWDVWVEDWMVTRFGERMSQAKRMTLAKIPRQKWAWDGHGTERSGYIEHEQLRGGGQGVRRWGLRAGSRG